MGINKPGRPFSSNQNVFWFTSTKIWITGSTTISIATGTFEKMNLIIVPTICLSEIINRPLSPSMMYEPGIPTYHSYRIHFLLRDS